MIFTLRLHVSDNALKHIHVLDRAVRFKKRRLVVNAEQFISANESQWFKSPNKVSFYF